MSKKRKNQEKRDLKKKLKVEARLQMAMRGELECEAGVGQEGGRVQGDAGIGGGVSTKSAHGKGGQNEEAAGGAGGGLWGGSRGAKHVHGHYDHDAQGCPAAAQGEIGDVG